MKLIVATTLALLAVAMGISINTKVYVQQSGRDVSGTTMEYVTLLEESGNGQTESSTDEKSVIENKSFPSPGMLIADRTFTGLPKTMSITVYEDDFGAGTRNDGVCRMVITASFSSTPTTLTCFREESQGRQVSNIIFVTIRTLP